MGAQAISATDAATTKIKTVDTRSFMGWLRSLSAPVPLDSVASSVSAIVIPGWHGRRDRQSPYTKPRLRLGPSRRQVRDAGESLVHNPAFTLLATLKWYSPSDITEGTGSKDTASAFVGKLPAAPCAVDVWIKRLESGGAALSWLFLAA